MFYYHAASGESQTHLFARLGRLDPD
ncbi:hypothetical protein LCGC14_1191980, partial [marine sediment metagenome]